MEKAKEADNKSVKFNKVVIAGVSNQWTDEDIKDGADADYVRRIRRRVDGELRPTATVILGFADDPPESVELGYRLFRTRT